MAINWMKRFIGLVIVLSAVACQTSSSPNVIGVDARQALHLIETNRDNPRFVILDIRTPGEFKQGHIRQATLLDYYHSEFKAGLERLDRDTTYLIYCRSGNRSGRTLAMIESMGFTKIYHLQSGIREWVKEGLPLVR